MRAGPKVGGESDHGSERKERWDTGRDRVERERECEAVRRRWTVVPLVEGFPSTSVIEAC